METKYIAFDGTEFHDYAEAYEYEDIHMVDKFIEDNKETFSHCHFYDDDLNEISILETRYKNIRCIEFENLNCFRFMKKYNDTFRHHFGIDLEGVPDNKEAKRLWNLNTESNRHYAFVTMPIVKHEIECYKNIIDKKERELSELNKALAFFNKNKK